MSVRFPQYDNPRLRGGSDDWDSPAGEVISQDYGLFEAAPSPIELGVSANATYADAGNSPASTETVGVDTTGSTTLVVQAVHQSPSGVTLTDSKGNTWLPIGSQITGDPDGTIFTFYLRGWYCDNPTVGAGHTFTVVGTSAYSTVFMQALEGTDTSGGSLHLTNGQADATKPFDSGSISTTEANCMLVGMAGTNASENLTLTPGAGFTIQQQQTDGLSYWTGALATRSVASTGSYEFSLYSSSGSSEGASRIAAFKGATAGSDGIAYPEGVQVTALTGAMAASGGAQAALTGAQAAAQAGSVTASGDSEVSVSGVEMVASAGVVSATGGALVEVEGVEAVASAGTVTAVGGGAGGATAFETGVEMMALAGNVTASAAEDRPSGWSHGGRREEPPSYISAVAEVRGAAAKAIAGRVVASASANVSVTGAQVSALPGVVTASGINRAFDPGSLSRDHAETLRKWSKVSVYRKQRPLRRA